MYWSISKMLLCILCVVLRKRVAGTGGSYGCHSRPELCSWCQFTAGVCVTWRDTAGMAAAKWSDEWRCQQSEGGRSVTSWWSVQVDVRLLLVSWCQPISVCRRQSIGAPLCVLPPSLFQYSQHFAMMIMVAMICRLWQNLELHKLGHKVWLVGLSEGG